MAKNEHEPCASGAKRRNEGEKTGRRDKECGLILHLGKVRAQAFFPAQVREHGERRECFL